MSRTTGQPFAHSYIELHKVRAMEFGLLRSEEVERMSVVKIDKERIYDDKGCPQLCAINDPRMGTMDKELRCFTCQGKHDECPGHFGHMELARPVYHGGLIEHIRKVLRCVCFNCSRLLLNKEREPEIRKIKRQSRFPKVLKLCDPVKICQVEEGGCGTVQPKFTKSGLSIKAQYNDQQYDQSRDRVQTLYPDEAFKVLQRITDKDIDLLGFAKESRPENMIIKNLAVAPPPVRPSVAMSSTNRSEDDLTYAYQQILKTNNQLQGHLDKGANQTTINQLRDSLQYYVATLMDNEIQGQPTQKHKSGKHLKAIRARLKGKEGRLRGNLMGKRVDFSARSVITPDPILRLDQLGVPQQIALNLTIPETVTSENIDFMRRLIHNGPNNWPGAKYILRHDDRQIDLASLKNRSDAHLEPGYRVERHLMNDDYVVFNRQPSLHKMSLMGHRVKVLPYSTFRLNLSVTTPYNADFDGDEMNMHVPQSYETKAEVKEIMHVPNQIVSPKDNKPVMGIVQDSLLGIMLFTLRDTFIEKELVMNLLMWANYEDGKFPTPAVLKPRPLWTGKQIFSLIIPDINLMRYSQTKGKPSDYWSDTEDKNILIQKGELICGNLNKSTIGSSSGGMIHIIWKEKGPLETREFMSNTQLIVNNWLHQNGFTVGVQDIIARKDTLKEIQDTLKKKQLEVQKILEEAQIGKLKQQPGKNMMESFEFEVNRILNEARDYAGNTALRDLYMWNRLKAMVTAGSKGSNLNISQIMACVGQQNVEGKRIPFGFHQRTLPHFSKDDFGPESKGFVENCYLNGLTPQEFFFHAMGGREGLIDTAVKTAETGYIQRRLIKALEDVMVNYDGTVRTSKGQVIQFLYGEDGMAGEHIEDLRIGLMNMDNHDIESKCSFLPLYKNSSEIEQILSHSMDPMMARSIVQDPTVALKLQKEFEQLIRDRDDLRGVILKGQNEEVHLSVNVPRIIWNAKEQFKIKQNSKTNLHPSYVLEKLQNLTLELTPIPGLTVRNDPLIMAAKENSTWLFKIYLRSLLCTKSMIQFERMSKDGFDWILGEIKSRFDLAIAHPGEMIGPIAAQSIGEPATQMTLNTFHFAGVSSKNVTLGVPRLKEIINVAKNIKTPSMKIYLLPEHKKDEKTATKFGGKIEYTTLSHVVRSSAIYYDPDPRCTIVKDDEQLLALYNEVPAEGWENNQSERMPWLLRFVLDNEKINFKHLSMKKIEKKLHDQFQDQFQIMHSDDNDDNLVLRIRIKGLDDSDTQQDEETACMALKSIQDRLLNEMALKGYPEITKVTFSKYVETEYNPRTGTQVKTDDNWLIETDGVALQKVLGHDKIDSKRTNSNDIQEILRVLGIEAVRLSLINELRFVLGSYGIYVNYRHLSTLCDVMTQRGILTSITRHGINRVDTGPLRKCSFEETVEILYEAAVFAETDPLSGISENIIMGQLAPYGTGCFDLVVDTEVLNEFAQAKPDDEDPLNNGAGQGEDTPMMLDPDRYYINRMSPDGSMTPIASQTPIGGQFGGGGGTEYSTYGTPKYAGDMSPGPGMNYGGASPGYGMSPSYMPSPLYGGGASGGIAGQSPIYQAYQSPIYQPTVGGMSPAHGHAASAMSPSYSPTNSRQSPSYNNYMSPAYASSNAPSASPAYYSTGGAGGNLPSSSATGGASSSYIPGSGSGAASYSPTNIHASPRYSPTTPNYSRPVGSMPQYSPQYSPTSNVYGASASPRYQVVSSSSHHAATPGASSVNPTPNSPGSGSVYIPSSPCYNPSSTSQQAFHAPVNRPAFIGGAAGGSPIDDSSSDNASTPNKQQRQ